MKGQPTIGVQDLQTNYGRIPGGSEYCPSVRKEGLVWVCRGLLGTVIALMLLGPSERRDIGERTAEAFSKRLLLLQQLCSSLKQEIIPGNGTF